MKLFTERIRAQLLRNGEVTARAHRRGNDRPDFTPVAKLFTPDAACTWLLTELDPDEPDIAFGLCDLGCGFPEFGYVRLSELEGVRGKLGLPVECDRHFSAVHTIRVYARAARNAAKITVCARALAEAVSAIANEQQGAA